MTTWRPDPDYLGYGLRTAAGACIAIGLAWAIGLEHPQWAGMTVWAASPPVREHLIEKSAFRALGTVIGAAFGVLLTGLSVRMGGEGTLVVGIALWLGLCAAAANLLRGFPSYGAILAGFTAVMVALLDSGQPWQVVALGLDRMATVLLGVLVALLIGLAFTPRAVEAEIPRRLRLANATILRAIAGRLRPQGEAPPLTDTLVDLAAIDEEVDGEAAGSPGARREARNRRETLMAEVAAILWLRAATLKPDLVEPDCARAAALDAIAELYRTHAPAPDRRLALARASRGAPAGLRRVLVELGAALPRRAEGVPPEKAPEPLALHRDVAAAREAGVRAAISMLVIGAIWIATGWSGGPMVMLGTAIMTTVFSTSDNPFAILPKVALGQAMGAAAAIACRWLLWPHLGTEPLLILGMLPFIAIGGLLTATPRLRAQAFDYNMVLLLLLQPTLPLTGSFSHSVFVGLAVASAPFIAWIAFRLIHPPSATRRRAALLAAMIADVEAMAARPTDTGQAAIRRARLHHRLLRLVRWSARAGTDTDEAAAAGLALLLAGRATLALETRLNDPGLADGARRRLRLARARLAALGTAPDKAAHALSAVTRLGGDDAGLLAAAAKAVGEAAPLLAK